MPVFKYTATFTAEAWINQQAVEVDAQGPTEWDVTAHVEANFDYWLAQVGEEIAHGDRDEDYAWTMGVLDRDDALIRESNAPKWARNWPGPFSIRVRRGIRSTMENLHMEGLATNEVANAVDQGLASLHARLGDRDELRDTYPDLSGEEIGGLAEAIETACDAWDIVADSLPGYRED